MTPLISIVIPFFNTNPTFFYKLLELVSKRDEDIECIIINDGSDIELSALIKAHCQKEKIIYYEYFPNKGVSHARNVGLSKASGKYILFVDSDDLIDISLLNTVVKSKLDKDLYLFKDCLILKNKPHFVKKELTNLEIKQDLSEMFVLNNLKLSMRSACNKLLKRDILETHNIRFNEELKFYEDSLFMSVFYQHCLSFEAYDNILYAYRIYDGSSSRRYNREYMILYNKYFNEFKKLNSNPNMLKGLYKDTIKNVLVDKTILDFKKCKFLHMYTIAKSPCVFESASNLSDDNNKFLRKLSNLIRNKHFFSATNRIIFHQARLYSLFLLNKIFRKSKI